VLLFERRKRRTRRRRRNKEGMKGEIERSS